MSWRDSFTAIGSFHDAEFVIRDAHTVIGRRNQTFEYPQKDKAYVEDLGLKATEFAITVYVVGENYISKRDKLRAAINKPGPGLLIHPYYGSKQVSVVRASIKESTRDAGMAEFNINFVEDAGAVYPAETTATQQATKTASESSLNASLNSFAKRFSTVGQKTEYLNEVIDNITASFQGIEKILGPVADDITQLISTPYEMAVAMASSIRSMRDKLDDPVHVFDIYLDLINKNEARSFSLTTPNRQQLARNQQAIDLMVQRAAITAAAELAVTTTYQSTDEAIRIQDALNTAINEQLTEMDVVDGSPIDDDVYAGLLDLGSYLSQDLRERAAKLPKVKTITLNQSLPALVLSHRLYSSADYDGDIVSRNKIRHPGFVPGGVDLSVLSEQSGGANA